MPTTRTTRSAATTKPPARPIAGEKNQDQVAGGLNKGKGKENSDEKGGGAESRARVPMKDRIASFTSRSNKDAASGSTSRVVSNPSAMVPRETLQTYLRIRPPPPAHEIEAKRAKPYLEVLSEKEVKMTPPVDPSKPSYGTIKLPKLVSFAKVFPPHTPQETFFTTTTLPMVEEVLQGQSGLIFSYGVSNSGKTYTIQGVEGEERGIVPRSVDVVFNSIEGLGYEGKVSLVGQSGIAFPHPKAASEETEASVSPELVEEWATDGYADDTSVKVDKNYSYAIFVAYLEVYNEKIFDLLESVPTLKPTPSSSTITLTPTRPPPKPTAKRLTGIGARLSLAAKAHGGSGIIKRQALAFKPDQENQRFVDKLKWVRVRSREEAHAVFRAGQADRQVFGTAMNMQSSRSHGVLEMKVVRIHNGAPNDVDSATVSKLSIVDLAGSERSKNTNNIGSRFEESTKINASLTSLGSCLRAIKEKQEAIAAGNKKSSKIHVPFKHSKLTELFQSFFENQGRAVMIININPYDTGYAENAHVVDFAADVKDIQTNTNKFAKALHRIIPKTVKVPVQLPKNGDSKEVEEDEVEIVETDADEMSDDDGHDPLVQYLFEENDHLRGALYEAEMRSATIEAEVREEVVTEIQGMIATMQERHRKTLADEVDAQEVKSNKKLDLMQREIDELNARLKRYEQDEDEDAESEVESSLIADDDADDEAPTSPTPQLRQQRRH